MGAYRYKATDIQGRWHRGRMDAANESDLELRLGRMGLELVSTDTITDRGPAVTGRGMKREDLINFCFHLEQLARAGVPILDGLGDLRESMDSRKLREVCAAIIEAIQGGKTLSQALEDFPAVFDQVFINLIRAGEESGQLPEVLRQMIENLKWQDEQMAHTKKLFMYPAFVGTAVIAVLFFLMIYLVPELLKFVKNMGEELPMHTKVLVFVSDVFVRFWYVILFLPIIIIATVMYFAVTNDQFRIKLDGWLLNVPVLGPIWKKLILTRFANYFALMYRSGVTVLDCMRISADIAGNKAVEQAIRTAGNQIADGSGIAASFANTGLFPPLVLRMLRIGENTGALDEALTNVGYFYSRDVRESIQRLQTIIGPAMTIVLGSLLAWVMFSVLGPIYDLISKIKI